MQQPASILAVMNHKGGVGKTTTSINLACCLAASGRNVLLIDMDPQGNCAGGLNITPPADHPGAMELVLGEATVDDALLETGLPGLSLIPSSLELATLSPPTNDDEDPEFWLAEALNDRLEDYDLVVIDCPPAFGMLSLNALIAASKVIIPVQSESFALTGLQQIIETITRLDQEAGHKLDYRILRTMVDSTRQLDSMVAGEIAKHFESRVFSAAIPRENMIAEGAFLGKPVLIHDAECPGTGAYVACAAEALLWIEADSSPLDETPLERMAYHEKTIRNGLALWKDLPPPGTPQSGAKKRGKRKTGESGQGSSLAGRFLTSSGNQQSVMRKSALAILALTVGLAVAILGMNMNGPN